MPKQNTTPQYQLEKPDETDFYDLDVINRNADKIEGALAGLAADAFIPYTSTYTPATHRHTLTPEQTGLALPDIFAARFVAAAGFAAGDTVYLDGVEYTPAYTDSSGAVEAGAWVAGAVVTLTVDKGEGKAYVGAGLGAALAKKAALDGKISIPSGTDANTILTPGSYYTNGSQITQTLLNIPPDINAGIYIDIEKLGGGNGVTQTLRSWGTGDEWTRSIFDTSVPITDWLQKATTTPPQEFNLPLAAGYTASQPCRYHKNQFGEVLVYFKAVNSGGIGVSSPVIATLPAGFRPTATVHAVCANADLSGSVCAFYVMPNGNIVVAVRTAIPAGPYAGFAGSISFMAAQ